MPDKKPQIPRSKTTKNVYDRKVEAFLKLTNPALKHVVGEAERNGAWLIYGREKNGKTQLALRLAKDIARHERVAYISAEEGVDYSFKLSMKRAGITTADDIVWDEYMPIEVLIEKYKGARQPKVIFLDNLTVYEHEIPRGLLKSMIVDALPNKTIIFVAHEERGIPSIAIAREAAKWAKVIFRVRALTAFVTGRYSKGGEVVIEEDTSELAWGELK